MDDTSIIQTRFNNDETDITLPSLSLEKLSLSDQASQEVEVAESFLAFVSSAFSLDVEIETRLESMQLCHTIGEGASFVVKRHFRAARHNTISPNKIGSQIIKVCRQTYFNGQKEFRKHAVNALMKELHVLGNPEISRHPNIVSLRAIGWSIESRDPLAICPALYLDEAKLGTLSEFEKAQVKISEQQRRCLGLDVSQGLLALHEVGIIHGDVKADNVLIFDDSAGGYTAKLSDFGCAVFLDDYKAEDPTHLVRLPGISRPWCAPEASTPLRVDKLMFTDVYSLGLLLFRLMMFTDPFSIFDLPVEKEERASYISRLLEMIQLPSLVPWAIEQGTDALWTEGTRLAVNGIFHTTLAAKPGDRNLKLVIALLELINNDNPDVNEVQDSIEQATAPCAWNISPTSPYAKGPPHRLNSIAVPFISIPGLPLSVRTQFQDYLTLIFDDICSKLQKDTDPIQSFEESVKWMLFNFYLFGYGGYEVDPKAAIETLYKAGLEENGAYWKSWCLLMPLFKAFQITPDPGQSRNVFDWTLRSAAIHEGFLTRLLPKLGLNDNLLYNKMRARNIGISIETLDWFMRIFEAGGVESHVTALDEHFDSVICEQGNTLLHLAAISDLPDLVRVLLAKKDVDVNAVNERSETALLVACQFGKVEIVNQLLDFGADASITTNGKWGVNALYWLSSFPEDQIEKLAARLHSAGAELQHLFPVEEIGAPLYEQDYFLVKGLIDQSPLLRAIGHGDLTAASTILRMTIDSFRKEDLNITIKYCFPPAILLAARLHLPLILDLLCSCLSNVMKDILAGSSEEWNPAMTGVWLQITNSPAPIEALSMEAHIERLCLHGSSWRIACHQTLDVLIKYGMLPQVIPVLGRPTNTLRACIDQFNNNTALEFLVRHKQYKAFVNLTPEFPTYSAIDDALDRGNIGAFHILVNAGAELDLRKNAIPGHRLEPSGASYLHVCASNRLDRPDVVARILDAGVPADIQNRQGTTPLTMAVMKCAFVIARTLIDRGASVNTPGLEGYTTLGAILEPMIAVQCDDLAKSVEFLLSLPPAHAPTFQVSAIRDTTAVQLASNFFAPTPPQMKVFSILLNHFSAPEQINARKKDPPYTSALQAAIFAHNLPGVRALLKVGADILINSDKPGDENAMALAIRSAHKCITQKSSLSWKDKEYDIRSSLEIITAIAEAGNWHDAFFMDALIPRFLQEAGDLIAEMKKLPHWERKYRGLDLKLHDIVENYLVVRTSSFPMFYEFTRQLNEIVKPVFYAEVYFHVRERVEFVTKDERDRARAAATERLPLLKEMTIKGFDMLQQSAVWEFVLDEIQKQGVAAASTEQDNEFLEEGLTRDFKILAKYARTGVSADLPMSRHIRYPEKLLGWYEDPHYYKQLRFQDDDEKETIDGFIEILRARDQERNDKKMVLTSFSEEFRVFHFQHLQKTPLALPGLLGLIGAESRCICMKPGYEIGNISMPLTEAVNNALEERFSGDADEGSSENVVKKLTEASRVAFDMENFIRRTAKEKEEVAAFPAYF